MPRDEESQPTAQPSVPAETTRQESEEPARDRQASAEADEGAPIPQFGEDPGV